MNIFVHVIGMETDKRKNAKCQDYWRRTKTNIHATSIWNKRIRVCAKTFPFHFLIFQSLNMLDIYTQKTSKTFPFEFDFSKFCWWNLILWIFKVLITGCSNPKQVKNGNKKIQRQAWNSTMWTDSGPVSPFSVSFKISLIH